MLNSYFPLPWLRTSCKKYFYFVYEREREVAENSNIYCNMARPSSLYNDLHNTNPTAPLQTYYVSIRGQCWFTVSMQHKVCKVTLKLPSSRIGLGLLVQGCICIIRSSHGFNAPVLPATASTGISWAWTTLGLNC